MKIKLTSGHFCLSILVLFLLLPILAFCSTPTEKSPLIRKAAKAGSWYDGSREGLDRSLSTFLENVPSCDLKGHLHALISPHAGYTWSGRCAAAAFKCIQGKNYRRVFVLGFSHHHLIRGVAVSSFDYYDTPLGRVSVDREICEKLLKNKKIFTTHKKAEEIEHSIENQVPFLQKTLRNFKIVPIMIGRLSSEEEYRDVASALKEYMDPHTLFVISSDFTHYGRNYGYLPFKENIKKNLEALDKGAISNILKVDFKGFQNYLSDTGDTICGSHPIGVLLQLLDKDFKGHLRMYYRSADLTGDFSNSVSYAAIAFTSSKRNEKNPSPNPSLSTEDPFQLNPKEQEILLKIARATLISHLTGSPSLKELLKKVAITDRMKEKRGVFVTLEKAHRLRGCIGYIQGIKPIFEAVQDNARSAATKDYRFPPMKASEIDKVKIEISVMTPLKQILSLDEIKVGRDGLIIEHKGRRGVLLPQVATDNNWNREQFLDAICRKAGLPESTWRTEKPVLKIFSAQVFGEE